MSSGGTDVMDVALLIAIDAKEKDLEVSVLIAATVVDAVAVAVPRSTHTRPTGVKPSPSESETTANPPWLRTSSATIVVASRLHRDASGSAIGAATVTMIVTSTAPEAHVAMTVRTTTGSAGIGRMNANDSTVVGLIEVRMMSSPTVMNGPQVLAVAAKKTKMTTHERTPVTPRYVALSRLQVHEL